MFNNDEPLPWYSTNTISVFTASFNWWPIYSYMQDLVWHDEFVGCVFVFMNATMNNGNVYRWMSIHRCENKLLPKKMFVTFCINQKVNLKKSQKWHVSNPTSPQYNNKKSFYYYYLFSPLHCCRFCIEEKEEVCFRQKLNHG